MNLDSAADALNAQSNLKAAKLEEFIYNNYQCCNKHWMNHPTVTYTTTFSEGVLSTKYNQSSMKQVELADMNFEYFQ